MRSPAVSRRALLAAAGALALPAVRAAAPLRIALSPFLSPAALLSAFRPLREHLERSLRRTVEMHTAKDFRSLVAATRRGEHDVVQLPAHLARLASIDWGWRQLAGTVEQVDVLVLVKGDGPIREPAALKGHRAGMLDALSLTATVGRRWLQQQRLAGAVEVVAQTSVNSAMFALDHGDVAMVVAGSTQLASLPAATPRGERVLATIGDIPGPIYLARPGLSDLDTDALRLAMVTFAPDPGRPLTASNAALRPLDEARMKALDPYAAIARQLLAPAR